MSSCMKANHGNGNSSSESERTPRILIGCLTIWLALTTARQAFDLIGMLWVLVFVNLMQIFACIAGIFAVFQPQRQKLLIAFVLSCPISTFYNIFIFLWYSDVLFADHRQIELLSAGLPFSYSFFLRHTPFCTSRFDLNNNRWIQDDGCVIPYIHLERFQASVHALLSILIAALSFRKFLERREEQKINKHCMARERRSIFSTSNSVSNLVLNGKISDGLVVIKGLNGTKELMTNSIAPGNIAITNSSANDLSIGYLNSSSESPEEQQNLPMKADAIGLFKKQNKRMYSGRMLKNAAALKNNVTQHSEEISPSAMGEVYWHEDYSSMSTAEAGGTIRDRQISESGQPILSKKLSGRKNCDDELISPYNQELGGEHQDHDLVRPYSRSSMQTFMSSSQRGSIPHRSFDGRTNYEREPKNGDYLEPKDLTQGRRNLVFSPNTTSLISFDPKSNTLIRYREHPSNSPDEDDLLSTSGLQSFRQEDFSRPYHQVLRKNSDDCDNDHAEFAYAKCPPPTTSPLPPHCWDSYSTPTPAITSYRFSLDKRNDRSSHNQRAFQIRQRIPFSVPSAPETNYSNLRSQTDADDIISETKRADASPPSTRDSRDCYWELASHAPSSHDSNSNRMSDNHNEGLNILQSFSTQQEPFTHSTTDAVQQKSSYYECTNGWPIADGPSTSFPICRNQLPRRSLVGYSASSVLHLAQSPIEEPNNILESNSSGKSQQMISDEEAPKFLPKHVFHAGEEGCVV